MAFDTICRYQKGKIIGKEPSQIARNQKQLKHEFSRRRNVGLRDVEHRILKQCSYTTTDLVIAFP